MGAPVDCAGLAVGFVAGAAAGFEGAVVAGFVPLALCGFDGAAVAGFVAAPLSFAPGAVVATGPVVEPAAEEDADAAGFFATTAAGFEAPTPGAEEWGGATAPGAALPGVAAPDAALGLVSLALSPLGGVADGAPIAVPPGCAPEVLAASAAPSGFGGTVGNRSARMSMARTGPVCSG